MEKHRYSFYDKYLEKRLWCHAKNRDNAVYIFSKKTKKLHLNDYVYVNREDIKLED